MWAANDGIENPTQGYQHLMVNHTYNFVDQATWNCTNIGQQLEENSRQ